MVMMIRTDEEDKDYDDSDYDNADKGSLCSRYFTIQCIFTYLHKIHSCAW